MEKSNKRKLQGTLHKFAKKRSIRPPQYGPEPPLAAAAPSDVGVCSQDGSAAASDVGVCSRDGTAAASVA